MDRPWIPFNKVEPENAKDVADAALFNLWQSRYKPKSSGSRSYHAFETEWNNKVGCRYRKHLEGDESVVVIHCKSVEYLKDYYKYTTELQQQSTMVVENDPIRKRLNDTLRLSRNSMEGTVPVHINQPMRYPFGPMPMGTPAAYNAHLITPVLTHHPRGNTAPSPWILDALNQPVNDPLKGCRRTMRCISCGDRRRNHAQVERFGRRCTRQYCAKCGWTRANHKDAMMGPYCTNERRHGSPDNEWYQ